MKVADQDGRVCLRWAGSKYFGLCGHIVSVLPTCGKAAADRASVNVLFQQNYG